VARKARCPWGATLGIAALMAAVACWRQTPGRQAVSLVPRPAAEPARPAFDKSKLAGWELAYVKDKDIWLAKGDLSGAKILEKNADSPTWSPDGKLLAYRKDTSIWIRDIESGRDRLLRASPAFASPEWSGHCLNMSFDPLLPELVVPQGKSLLVIDLKDKGRETSVLDRGIGHPSNPVWSRSGRWLAFTESGDVWLADRQGDDWKGFRDTPELEGIVYYDDAARIAPIGQWLVGEIGASSHTPFWVDGLSWAPDEKRLYFHFQRQGGSGVSEVGYIDFGPAKTPTLHRPWFDDMTFTVSWITVKDHDILFDPAVCPNGSAIAVTIQGADDENYAYKLCLIDNQGNVLATLGEDAWQAAWRPQHRSE
jgi:WD40-like Beta Propeller Repeat